MKGIMIAERIKKELIDLTSVDSPTIAKRLLVSRDTAFYILRLLDNLPVIRKHYQDIANKQYESEAK